MTDREQTRRDAPRIPELPKGRKVNIGWTSRGRRLTGTCWTTQVESFIERRILPGSTSIVLVVHGGRRYILDDKP